jgi:hypothetical protein
METMWPVPGSTWTTVAATGSAASAPLVAASWAEVPHPLAVPPALAEGGVGQELLFDVVAEEAGAAPGGDAAVARLADVQAEAAGLGAVGLLLADVAGGDHALQDDVPARAGGIRCVDRVVRRRGLHQAGEERGLVELQVRGVLGKVPLGGGLDAVRLLAEEGDVEVVRQDLVLGQLLLDLDGVLDLADLAAQAGGAGLLGGLGYGLGVVPGGLDQDVLHVLHGEGGAALGDAAGLHVPRQGAQHALEIDGAVLVEAGVLDGDDGLLHVVGHPVERDDRAVPRVDVGDRVAVGVEDGGLLAQRRLAHRGGDLVEALRGAPGGEAEEAERGQRDAGQHGAGQQADPEETGREIDRAQRAQPAVLTVPTHGGSLRSKRRTGDHPFV